MSNTISYLELLSQLKGIKREIKYGGLKLIYGISYERKDDSDYGGYYEKLLLNIYDPDIQTAVKVVLREGYDVLDKAIELGNVDDELEDLVKICELELQSYINGKNIKNKFENIKSNFQII